MDRKQNPCFFLIFNFVDERRTLYFFDTLGLLQTAMIRLHSRHR
jgi:hypothetical protein